MNNRTCRLLAMLTIGGASLAHADIFTTTRTVDYSITFSDAATFLDAFANVTNTEVIGPGSFGTDTEMGGYSALNTGITFFATGAVSISPAGAPPGTSEITTTVTATGAGTYGFHEAVPVYNGRLAGLNYFPGPLARFPYNGSSTLEIFSPSDSFLDPGGTFATNIYLPGDWSKAGNADQTGTHLLYSLDPLWTITNDFVYDPATNRTLFSIVNTNYPGADSDDPGPYPVILLTGAAVPEPGSIGLLGVGALAVAGWYLKKRMNKPSLSVDAQRGNGNVTTFTVPEGISVNI